MGKYSHVTKYLDMMEPAGSVDEALAFCYPMEEAMFDPEIVDRSYSETLEARGLSDDPMSADVDSLDIEGAIALLTYAQRIERWCGNGEGYRGALESGLLVRLLRRIRELDESADS